MIPRLLLPLLLALALPAHAGDTAAEARKLKLAYALKLDQLLTKAKTEGDTAAAKEIEGMIAQVEKSPTKDSQANKELESIVGQWRRDHDGMLWTFHDATKGTGGSTNFTMTYDPKSKEITLIGPDAVTSLKFTNDDNVLRGEDRKGQRFTIRRVK